MAKLIEHSLDEVRSGAAAPADHATFSLADFVAEAAQSAQFDADSRGCQFTVLPVAPDIALEGSRELLLAALANLLHNAFKFTLPHSKVTLAAHVKGERVLIEVSDHCGGLLAGSAENMFTPFTQQGTDKSGVGLGLSIARQSVTTDGGSLTVENHPEIGCVFIMNLPLAKSDK